MTIRPCAHFPLSESGESVVVADEVECIDALLVFVCVVCVCVCVF